MARRLLLSSLVVALAACSNNGETPADTASAAAGSASSAAATADEGAGRIRVAITGGEHAGTYEVTGTDGCSHGLAGEDAWGNQFSRDSDNPRELTSVQLVVPETKAAAGGTDTFQLTVSFGPMLGEGRTDYTVNTRARPPRGSGTVMVDDRGQAGTVTFDATTEDGVKLQGTIECDSVMRA